MDRGGEDFQASHKDRIKAVISIPNESSEVTNCNVGKQFCNFDPASPHNYAVINAQNTVGVTLEQPLLRLYSVHPSLFGL